MPLDAVGVGRGRDLLQWRQSVPFCPSSLVVKITGMPSMAAARASLITLAWTSSRGGTFTTCSNTPV